LSGFDYENLEAVCEFSSFATQELKKITQTKTLILTMIQKRDDGVYNVAKIFKNGEVVHQRAKAKLFKLGDEHKYMQSGDEAEIEIFEIDGIKFGLLICFELRFKKLWQKLEGADVILAPSWWGASRSKNFKTLTQALAVINQCYVVATDSKNKECTGVSVIITPFGDVKKDLDTACLEVKYDPKEIKKMRKYLDVGIG
jgi:predicted amidohydrolase